MSATLNSCASSSQATGAQNEPSAFKYSKVQKLLADKAFKLSTENNPISALKFTADPAVLVYKDTVYIYGTNDTQQVEATQGEADNSYNRINTLNVYSSKDLVNWTDCGIVKVAGRSGNGGAALWANNSWAPAIAAKTINGVDKFFLYFADSANGIGVLSADSPTGPFTDPIGKALISRSTPNTNGVHWLFDPAVIVDDDGNGYLYYGGGVKDDNAHPKSARCVALNDDMISIKGTPVEIDAPWLFEDSGINKMGNKYYYSYCANWASRDGATGNEVPPTAVIAYMTSENPLGPFTYQGYTLKNPGSYFGPWGNNHHWIFQFNGKWYIAYHTQVVEKQIGLLKGGYRNVFIDEFKVNEDGSWPIQNGTKAGCKQIKAFNPYEKVPAATMHSSVHMVISENQAVFATEKNGYIRISKADFSKGASKIEVKVAEGSKKGTLKVCLDNMNGDALLGTVNINGAGTAEANLTLPAGGNTERDLFFVFDGDFAIEEWEIKE